jgi:hypothetical protein
LYDRFFKPEQSAKEIESIVEQALTLFFDGVMSGHSAYGELFDHKAEGVGI